MSLERERAKERTNHTYHFLDFTLSCVSVVMLVLAVALLKVYKPSYDTIDLAVTLSIGEILAMISMQSHKLISKRHLHKLEEVDEQASTARLEESLINQKDR